MSNCSSGKRSYLSESLAEEALIGAHINYHYTKGQGPIGIYQCELCGQYHLTSKGNMNQRLEKALQGGTIKKGRDANWWENQSKKR